MKWHQGGGGAGVSCDGDECPRPNGVPEFPDVFGWEGGGYMGAGRGVRRGVG